MPALTHVLGPAVDAGSGNSITQSLKRDLIVRELIGKLPRSSAQHHTMHDGFRDVIAFQEMNYSIGVEFSFEIKPRPANIIWSELRDKTRNAIRRARESMECVELADPEEFTRFYISNLEQRNLVSYYDVQTITRVCEAVLFHGQGKVLTAVRKNGGKEASIFYIWDERRCYYFMSTRHVGAHNGAVSMLLWNAISDAASRGLVFDFDGIGTAGNKVFLLGFGGVVYPRYNASKMSASHKLKNSLEFRANHLRSRMSARLRAFTQIDTRNSQGTSLQR